MPAIKVGVREFREQIARFLESDTPVAVTRRGETLGVYVPTPRKSSQTADKPNYGRPPTSSGSPLGCGRRRIRSGI